MATQCVKDCERLAQLRRWLARFEIDDEAHADIRRPSQLILAQIKGAACGSYGFSEFLWRHFYITEREYSHDLGQLSTETFLNGKNCLF